MPRWWRKPIVGAAIVNASCIIASLRTAEFGTTYRVFFGSIVVAGLLTMPLMALAALGLPWRRAIVRWFIVAIVSVLVAEAWAGAQELAFRRKVKNLPAGASTFEARWWPFTDNGIGYDPSSGFWGQD